MLAADNLHLPEHQEEGSFYVIGINSTAPSEERIETDFIFFITVT